MSANDWVQLLFFIVLLLIVSPIFGKYIAKVYQENPTHSRDKLEWLEMLCYRISGVNAKEEMSWTTYLKCLFFINLFGFFAVFLLELFQHFLPFNPQHFSHVPIDLAMNTAMSFVTNTNWQAYSGENTL